MIPLASAEMSRNLSTHLTVLADIQKKIKELHEQQVTVIHLLEARCAQFVFFEGTSRRSYA